MGEEKDETIFVTDDTFVRNGGKLDETDIEIIKSARSGEGIEIKNTEELMELAKGLSDTFDYYREQARKLMTLQQALSVRWLRVYEHCSWRTVARACSGQNWPDWEPWEPASSQPMGMALCEGAAQFFGENYREPPWN